MNLHVTAERLLISQQGLSTHIKQIESYYGTVLFERKPKLQLTPEGELFLKEAQVIIESDKRLKLLFSKNYVPSEGSIRVACSMVRSTLFMPQVLSEFNKHYPYVSIMFSQYNGSDNTMLEENKTDILIGHNIKQKHGIKSIPLYPVLSGIGISDNIIKKYYPDQTVSSFVEAHKNGIDFSDIPVDIPLAFTKARGKPWLLEQIPMIEKRKVVFINPSDHKKLAQSSSDGELILLYSLNYLTNLKKEYPDAFKNVHLFPHLSGDSVMRFTETCSYTENEPHPDFFYAFINILKDVTRKLTL